MQVGRKNKRILSYLLLLTTLLLQVGVDFVPQVQAAADFVIRSGTMNVNSTGLYASQSKDVTIPATEVTNATVTTNNGTATLTRNNNQITVTMSGGDPTSFTNGSVTLTDNGNTTNSGSASTVIPGLYNVVSSTSTNGTVTTQTSGDTLTATWSGGNKYQVRVPPYTQTTQTTTYQYYTHHAQTFWATCSPTGQGSSVTCTGHTTNYSYDSNCNLQSSYQQGNTVTIGAPINTSPSNSGTISCSKPVTTTTTTDAYNYEDRWDYSSTHNYRTATYAYNNVVTYDYKDYAPVAPTLTAPQDLSDGGTITFSKPTDDYTAVDNLLVSLEWQQEGSSNWNPIVRDKKITDSVFTVSGSNVSYNWNSSNVNGMIKLRLVTKDGFNEPVYSYVNGDPANLFRLSHKPIINAVSPIGGSQANTVTPTYKWTYNQDEGEIQKGFFLQVREVGASTLTLDTGLVTSSLAEYVQPSSTPLEWGSAHEWRIQPISVTGVLGDWTAWQAFGANSIPELEGVTTVTTDTLHVKTKPTPDTTGYKYYRGPDEIHDGPELEIDDSSLPSNTEQQYNVRAYNAVAQSPLSSTKSAFTLAKTPEFEGIETTSTSLIVKLKEVNPQYTYHEIEFRKKGESSWLPLASGPGDLFVRNSVDKDTAYEIRVRDFNGMTNPSGIPTDYAVMEATTKVDVPTNAIYTDVTADSFTVTIDPNGNAPTTKYRFWIEGVTDRSSYDTSLSYTFTGLPEGNRTYTVVGQAMGINSESSPIALGTVTTKAYPVNIDEVTLTAEAGKIKGSFATGKNASGTKYEISDGATGQVLSFNEANTSFELNAPNPNEKHTITIRAQDKLLNVTDPVTKDIYSLSVPVTAADLTVVSSNEVKLAFDLNGNPADTEIRVQSIKGDTFDSGWIAGSSSLQILERNSNTQQQYEIKTRNKDGIESIGVASPAKYTLANPIITGNFAPSYTNIKLTLIANNPPHTEYKITNTTTGDIRDWSNDLIWDNGPLLNESENVYIGVVRNGDGIETAITNLGSIKTSKALGEFFETPREPVPSDQFDPDTRDGKTISHNGKDVILIKGQELPLLMSDLKNIEGWRYNINDGAWSEWLTPTTGTIKRDLHVNEPGLYKVTINFRNQFGNDGGTIERWYLADWIAPELSTHFDKITKEPEATFGMTYSDNLGPTYGFWYQVDEEHWKPLSGDSVKGALPQDNKFKSGFVRISDIVGNVKAVPYEILTLNNEYLTFTPREGGYKVTFNVEAKPNTRYHVKTTNLRDDDFQINESSLTNTIDVPGLTGSKYDATIGIRLPGESFWYDPDKYPVILGLDMPTLMSQEASATQISFTLNPVDGAETYKIKRSDKTEQPLTGTVFTDNDVLAGRPYTYEFWAEGGSLKSAKNTLTIWTKPNAPLFEVVKITGSSIKINVGLNNNPEDIAIEAKHADETPVSVNGTSIEETGLTVDTDYTYSIRVKSGNNEYSDWVTQTFRTGDGSQEFFDTANELFAAVKITPGKDETSQKGYADIVITDLKGLSAKGTIETAQKILGTQPTRYDELDLDRQYSFLVEVTDGQRTTQKQYSFRTPSAPATGGGTEEETFKNEAGRYIDSLTITSDGEVNSGKAWIEITSGPVYQDAQVTIAGVTKHIVNGTLRFDGADDNTTYSILFEIKNGSFVHKVTKEITTPNRTAPTIQSISMNGEQYVLDIQSVGKISK